MTSWAGPILRPRCNDCGFPLSYLSPEVSWSQHFLVATLAALIRFSLCVLTKCSVRRFVSLNLCPYPPQKTLIQLRSQVPFLAHEFSLHIQLTLAQLGCVTPQPTPSLLSYLLSLIIMYAFSVHHQIVEYPVWWWYPPPRVSIILLL